MKLPYSTQWDPIEMFCSRHTFFVTIYGLKWSSFNIRLRSCVPMCHWLRDITLSSNDVKLLKGKSDHHYDFTFYQ